MKKDVLDLLNRERSILADLTRVKLTKTLNLEKIEIQKARVEILKELYEKTKTKD